jgi:hypothetical protein
MDVEVGRIGVGVEDASRMVGVDAAGVVQETSAQTRNSRKLFFIVFPFHMVSLMGMFSV